MPRAHPVAACCVQFIIPHSLVIACVLLEVPLLVLPLIMNHLLSLILFLFSHAGQRVV